MSTSGWEWPQDLQEQKEAWHGEIGAGSAGRLGGSGGRGTALQERQGGPWNALPNLVARTWRASKLASDKTQFALFHPYSLLRRGENRVRHD